MNKLLDLRTRATYSSTTKRALRQRSRSMRHSLIRAHHEIYNVMLVKLIQYSYANRNAFVLDIFLLYVHSLISARCLLRDRNDRHNNNYAKTRKDE